MNGAVDAACSACGSATTYDGSLPILCCNCRSVRQLIQAKLAKGETPVIVGYTPAIADRLMLPDHELTPV